MVPAPKRVLVADDQPVLRAGVRALVEARADWQVVAEASDGAEALEAARRTRPDIAILAYALPLLNGAEVTQRLKAELPGIEILIFTSHASEDVIWEVLTAGASGYVLETDPGQSLVAAIGALSRHKPYFSGTVSETLLRRFLTNGPGPWLGTLTHRERDVVKLIAEGKVNRETACILDVSVKTVETHRAAAMQKLNIRTAADLVRYAIRNHIAQP